MSVAARQSSAAALPDEPKPDEPKPEEPAPPVESLLLTALVRNYPSEHYTDEVLRGLFGDIAGDVVRGKQLRRVALANHDEPACVFRVFRSSAAQEGGS